MTQVASIAQGTPCWCELMTRDVAKAQSFYGTLFGWTVQSESMGDFMYHLLKSGETSFGGMMDAGGNPEWENIPPHWMTYFHVDDVDDRAAQVEGLGGTICVPPTDIPQVGRFCVVNDPTGAAFTLFSSNTPYPLSHTIAWTELMTRDSGAARKFYEALLGVTFAEMPMGPAGTYLIMQVGEQGVAGCMQMGPEYPAEVPSHWLPYIGTEAIDAKAEEAAKLGATILHPPTDIPGDKGRFCVVQDPTGAVIGFYQCPQSAQPC